MFTFENIAVFYGSETGNSESLARRISLESTEKIQILFPSLASNSKKDSFELLPLDLLESWAKKSTEVSQEPRKLFAIIVTSSTGDGEPPQNAMKLFDNLGQQQRRLDPKGKSCKTLLNLSFALLGMGDKDYDDTFGKFPRDLYEILVTLGAKPVLPLQVTDENEGIEIVSEPWIQSLWLLLEVLVLESKPVIDLSSEVEKSNSASTVSKETLVEISNGPLSSISEINTTLPRHYNQKLNLLLNQGSSKVALTSLPRLPAEVCLLETSIEQGSKPEKVGLPEFLHTYHPTLFMGKITKVKSLTSVDAVKRTLELEVKIPTESIQYTPGDVVGILQPNDTMMVKLLLERLRIENGETAGYQLTSKIGKLPSHLDKVSGYSPTGFEILQHLVDISNVSKKPILRVLSQYCTNQDEGYFLDFLVSKQGTQEFNTLREQSPTLLDLLNTFPSSHPPLQRLLDVLSPLQPRYYSIASSPITSPSSINLIFNVVQFQSHGLLRHGLFTPWVDIATGSVSPKKTAECSIDLALFLKPPGPFSFHLPSTPRAPLILVGPGTGIAPLMGFVRHRQAQRNIARRAGTLSNHLEADLASRFGSIWLIAGFRDPEKDFLINQELTDLVSDGTITRLDVAFSRVIDSSFCLTRKGTKVSDPVLTNTKYVQDCLKAQSSYWRELMLEKGAYFYLCGDAGNMAKDVNTALLSMLEEGSDVKMTPASAAAQLLYWTKEGFVKRDLVSCFILFGVIVVIPL